MSKKLYNLVLQPGTDEAAFLSNEAAGMDVHDNLNLFDMLLCMMLTEEEAATLKASEKVFEIEAERQVIETSYPTTTPRYESTGATFRTRTYPPTSGNGKNYTGMNMFFTSEFDPASGFAGSSAGYFGDFNFDDSVKSNFLGEYVDIVAIEAGTPTSAYDGHENHVDFQEFDSTNSKFVKMDWSTYNGSASAVENNQVTNPSGPFWTAHAAGVLSAAGGKYCGWGKKSTLRVIYLSNGTNTAYYSVLQWHISKAVNPATGVRNATVVTGAWGYTGLEHEEFFIIDDIASMTVQGGSVVTNRPTGTGSAQALSFTAAASDSSNYQVSGTDRNGSVSGNDPTINMVVGDTINMTNNASGGHPMYFKTAATTGTGNQVSGATGQGSGSMSWTPSAAGTYYYICQYHSGMVGTLTVTAATPAGWGTDLTPFTSNGIIPRVINDPADNTDKWMLSIPYQSRFSSFDTVMGTFNNYNGIYCFKSAGNNSHIAVNPLDTEWNNYVTPDGGYRVLNTLDSEGKNQFTSSSQSDSNQYVLRTAIDGGPDQFTIAACQQDDTNRLLDDYSNRGKMIDFASYGAYTWTSNPSFTYSDGKWGYFSGTSCAAPVAAGCAAVFLDHWFTQRGVYPSLAQLKSLMIKNAKANLIGEDLIDFTNIPTAADISSTKLYSSTEVNRVKDDDYQNGGADLSELYGTPALRVHIPWGIRMGSGKYIAGGSEQTTEGRRPLSGRAWPRSKTSFSS